MLLGGTKQYPVDYQLPDGLIVLVDPSQRHGCGIRFCYRNIGNVFAEEQRTFFNAKCGRSWVVFGTQERPLAFYMDQFTMMACIVPVFYT
jgi:hypothetical protein